MYAVHCTVYTKLYTEAHCTLNLSARVAESSPIYYFEYYICFLYPHLYNDIFRSSALTSIIKPLPGAMLKLADGRDGTGLFGTTWFSKKSKLSLEFRLIARILATFILHQVGTNSLLWAGNASYL